MISLRRLVALMLLCTLCVVCAYTCAGGQSVPQDATDTVLANNASDMTGAFEDEIFLWAVYYVLGKDEDEPLAASEVAAIEELKVASNGIGSLKGLEYFSGLKLLDCSENDLQTLDTSFCPMLEKLDCTINFLTSLDVTCNPKLMDLACADNQLMTLDVSQNSALINLYCFMNELATLDVTQNPALEDLRCSNNLLTTLDVSQNPVLARLYCHGNYLPSEAAIIGLDESLSDSYDKFSFDPQKDTIDE